MELFVISDTHFDSEEVLRKSGRPFETVEEMNHAIISNWQSTIDEDDSVLFLGDLANADSEEELWEWFGQLPGNITYLYGNHCPVPKSSFTKSSLPLQDEHQFTRGGIQFHCAHKSEWVSSDHSGWTIHGHEHEKEPFVNPRNKSINASVDVIGFKPVPMSEIVELVNRGKRVQRRGE